MMTFWLGKYSLCHWKYLSYNIHVAISYGVVVLCGASVIHTGLINKGTFLSDKRQEVDHARAGDHTKLQPNLG